MQRQSSCYILSGVVDAAAGGSDANGGGGFGGNGGGDERDGPRTDDAVLLTKQGASAGALAAGGEGMGSMRLLALVVRSEVDPPGSSTRWAVRGTHGISTECRV